MTNETLNPKKITPDFIEEKFNSDIICFYELSKDVAILFHKTDKLYLVDSITLTDNKQDIKSNRLFQTNEVEDYIEYIDLSTHRTQKVNSKYSANKPWRIIFEELRKNSFYTDFFA